MKKIKLQTVGKWVLCAPLILAFGCASFEITSSPKAAVYEGGKKVATTPYKFNLMAGERAFILKRAGYVEVEVVVSSLDKKQLHYRLAWVGRTRIDTLPRGADILNSISREELGVTPCGLRLAVPEHVLIEMDGFESVQQELVPNESYVIELKPLGGFKSSFYKDISFSSDQGAVEIFDRVAGEKIGSSPEQLTIEAGSELEYRLPGFKTRVALISRNAPRYIRIQLDPIERVTITGPAGAAVYRAGGVEQMGEVPHTVEVNGDTLYEVRMEGFYESTIAVSPGSPSNLKVELKKIPYKTIVTTPPGAEVYRLGGLEKLGDSPFTTIVDGERVFEIKKRGYRSTVIGMGSSSPTKLNVPLSPAPRDDPDAAALGTLDNSVISTH